MSNNNNKNNKPNQTKQNQQQTNTKPTSRSYRSKKEGYTSGSIASNPCSLYLLSLSEINLVATPSITGMARLYSF